MDKKWNNYYITELSTNDHSNGRQQRNVKTATSHISPKKSDRSWARSTGEKSILFVENFTSVFTSNSDNNNDDDTVS
jgi:hypothetical protein